METINNLDIQKRLEITKKEIYKLQIENEKIREMFEESKKINITNKHQFEEDCIDAANSSCF